jgi:hypothetical protein
LKHSSDDGTLDAYLMENREASLELGGISRCRTRQRDERLDSSSAESLGAIEISMQGHTR